MKVNKEIRHFYSIEEGAFWLVSKIIAYGKLNVISIDIQVDSGYYTFQLWVKESVE